MTKNDNHIIETWPWKWKDDHPGVNKENNPLKNIPEPLSPVIHMTHPFCPSIVCLSCCPIGQLCHRILVDFPMFDIPGFSLADDGYQEMVSATLFLLLSKKRRHESHDPRMYFLQFFPTLLDIQKVKIYSNYLLNIHTNKQSSPCSKNNTKSKALLWPSQFLYLSFHLLWPILVTNQTSFRFLLILNSYVVCKSWTHTSSLFETTTLSCPATTK